MSTRRYKLDEFLQLLMMALEEHAWGWDPEVDDPVTKLQLSHACAEALDWLGSFECIWCGVDTLEIGEYYSVKDDLWNKYGPAHGCLCIGCLEGRLGRQLVPGDFTSAPINERDGTSHRLLNRLGREAEAS
ncbi:hypothetical protein ACEWX3_07535 [Mycobacterium sp. G7A2]|uniref:hypothetical protein n=1 Tax=Mycobacterium sp. G7A2 TaxID=3317307 RepID=UPI0035A95DC2